MTDWLGMLARPRAPRPELKARVLADALRPRRRRPALLAAAAVVAVALLGGAWWAGRTITGLEAELAAARDTLELLLGPDTRAVTVPISTGGRPGAVTIIADRATRRWLVRCEGMAPNRPDQTYQLWFVTERGMKRAALMTMDESESRVMALAFPVPGDVGRVVGAAMSIEPRAGSAEPRGPMVFQVDL